jgi:predicted dehydrogenase
VLASDRLKVAIIGASGIGRHHAKWLNALGAEVGAIVGTSAATLEKAAPGLNEIFAFTGRRYTTIPEMLDREDPELVHVCTPPHLHHQHVLALATHRCHVLCEKPLTWDESKPAAQLLDEAREMVAAVARPGRVAAANLQYTAVPAAYFAHGAAAGWPIEPPRRFFMHLDSRRERNVYEIIWRELSPHTLSVMAACCGPGQVDHDTVDLTLAERLCRARLTYRPAAGPACECELVVGCVPEGQMTRRIGINGHLVDYEGRNDPGGVFRTYLRSDDIETESDDFMYLSMRQVVLACTGQADRPLATMAEGLRNQEMQLGIVALGQRVA